MENKNKYKYFVMLFSVALGLSLVNPSSIEAAGNRDLTVETDLASIPNPEVQLAEDPVVRASEIMSWDITNFKKLTDWQGVFLDEKEIVTPIDAKYSFNLSMTPETVLEGVTLNPKYPASAGHILLDNMSPGESFIVRNAGFYKGQSLDVVVTIVALEHNPSEVGDEDETFNLMFNDNYFGGVNLLSKASSRNTSGMVELTYTTVDSEGTPVPTSGILPYNNVTERNLVTVDSDLIKGIYGPATSVVKYQEGLVSNEDVSFSSEESAFPGISPERRLAILYDEVETRTFRIDLPSALGFVMDNRSPVPIAVPDPFVYGNEYDKGEEEMFYEIDQDIPLEPYAYKVGATPEQELEARKYMFKDFNFEIPLNPAIAKVDQSKLTITTDRGLELRAGEDYEIVSTDLNGQETLSIKLLESFRHSGTGNRMGLNFYGRRMIVRIPVAPDPDADLTPFITEDEKLIRIPLNGVKTTIDDFYQTVEGNEGFAEATNQGSLRLTHVDENDNKIREDVEATGILGKPWDGGYSTTGGYIQDKIYLGDEQVSEIIFKGFVNSYKMTFEDKRYDFEMTASSPEDPVAGTTVKQNEEMTYALNITSRAEKSDLTDYLNNYESIKVILDDYNTDLLKNPEEAELKIGESVIATASYDEASTSYNFVGINPDVLWSEDLKLIFKATTQADATVGETIRMNSSVALTFKDADINGNTQAIPFSNQATPVETEIMEERLMFESHPSDIDFGTIKATTFGGVKTYSIQSMSDDLVIRDERKVNAENGWTLSAKLDQEFTIAGTTESLPGILKYLDDNGNIETLVADDSATLIHKQATTTEDLTNVSKDWQKENRGLVLQLFTGEAKVDEPYVAKIKWQLVDGL